jgi:hypothetical protein
MTFSGFRQSQVTNTGRQEIHVIEGPLKLCRTMNRHPLAQQICQYVDINGKVKAAKFVNSKLQAATSGAGSHRVLGS